MAKSKKSEAPVLKGAKATGATTLTGATTPTATATNKELVVLLMKHQGIHEGYWILSAILSFGALNIGQSADGSDAVPAGFVGFTGVRLERVPKAMLFFIEYVCDRIMTKLHLYL